MEHKRMDIKVFYSVLLAKHDHVITCYNLVPVRCERV